MKSVILLVFLVLFGLCAGGVSVTLAADGGAKRIALPKPETTGGIPLMEALSKRAANRSFLDKPLSEQVLSNLLWATWGVNRPDGRRTAPTARNSQAIQVYAALESGIWLYDGAKNELFLALAEDTRAKFGGAPLTLLYAAPADQQASGMHAGSLYQNAGLFCASVGLANVVKTTGINALDGSLKLPDGYRIFVVQSIGWPK